MTASEVVDHLVRCAEPSKALNLARFFKTGPGEYGEGDVFMGVMVPEQRAIAKKFENLPLVEVDKLVKDNRHEVRLTGLLILVYRLKHADKMIRKNILDFYLSNTAYINNWDLVDVTVRDIVGSYVCEHKNERTILYKLATSANLWERRMAIVATSYAIGKNQFSDTLKIARMFINDRHDLIHKATGWMLREVGKRDRGTLVSFLDKHASLMPRTMLRYSLEKFPPSVRARYMKMR